MSDDRSSRYDVLQPGISISSKNSTNGTLGLIVFDRRNEFQPCILSNWHILAARRPKKFGLSLKPGAVVYQPGRLKGGKNPKNIIAKLVRSNTDLDCAISRITERTFILTQYESDIEITSVRVPKKGDVVEKSGAVSGVTRARVSGVNGNWVSLEPINSQSDEISVSGDSGSIWYDPETKEGMILHSRGDDDTNTTTESASGLILKTVLDVLDVSLRPE